MNDYKASMNKNFDIMENSVNKMWDMWRFSLGSLVKTQEQLGNMARKQLDQSKTAQADLIKIEEEFNKQVRNNQARFQNMVKESVMNTYESANKAN